MRDPEKTSNDGFTLLELVIVIAIVSLLAGLLIPAGKSLIQGGRAQRILSGVDYVKSASQRFWHDTGQFPLETTGTKASPLLDQDSHQLSMNPNTPIAGWNGPYLEHPLGFSDNPYNEMVIVENFAAGSGPIQYDLYGDGSAATGYILHIRYYLIPQEIAVLVDEQLDNGVPGDWYQTGRVQWDSSGSQNILSVLLIQTDQL